MCDIKEVNEKDEKTRITLEIMNALPLWFSPPEDIQKKSLTHRDYPFFAAFEGVKAIGFVALKIHNRYTADIYNLGVLEEYHRQGIGHDLVLATEKHCKSNGYLFLTVKTLDESAIYEPYIRTRAFYRKNGFIPLEVFTTVWDEKNPCLFLAKYLGT